MAIIQQELLKISLPPDKNKNGPELKLNAKFGAKLDAKLDEKLDAKLDEKLDWQYRDSIFAIVTPKLSKNP